MQDSETTSAADAALLEAERLYSRYIDLAKMVEAQTFRALTAEASSDQPEDNPDRPAIGLRFDAEPAGLVFS